MISDEPSDVDFQFVYKDEDKASGAVLYYYKHRIVRDLDDNIGDIQSSIADRQKALIVEMEDEVGRLVICWYASWCRRQKDRCLHS